MTLMRQARIKAIRVEFDDGSEEHWTFPDGSCAFYKESDNSTTERDPVQEIWVEHDIRWTSNRMRRGRSKKKAIVE